MTVSDERRSCGYKPAVFLQKIRNAVAHVNIEFVPNIPVEDPSGVELWNVNNGTTDFRVSISVRNFMVFLNELGHQFADVYLNSTTDPR